MANQTILLLCALIGVASTRLINPRDLVDEAHQQLEELQQIVQGNILGARNNLDTMDSDFQTTSDNTLSAGSIATEQEANSIEERLSTIKGLANAASVDVSSCLDVREDNLASMPANYAAAMEQCIRSLVSEALRLTRNARTNIDNTINQVHNLERELMFCGESVVCVSPIVTEIELSKIRIPLNINTEVLACENLHTALRISVNDCSTDNISQYTMEANAIIAEVTNCVENLLS